MKRLFLAVRIDVDDALREHYERIRGMLRGEPVRWVDLRQWHLTLHFFGDTEEERLVRLQRLCEEHLAGLPAFRLVLRGTGVFPHLRRPRVLWLGMDMPPQLKRLHEAVEDILVEGDFELPDKPFAPHLTIGRIKGAVKETLLRQLIEQEKEIPITGFDVKKVHLVESVLRPEGPVYTDLSTYPLVQREEQR